MDYILIRGDDLKSKKWSEAVNNKYLKVIKLKGPPILDPYLIIKYIFEFKKVPKGYIFRYLNDYPNLIKTILKFISELLIVFFSKIFRYDLIWILHNVDKETTENYPKITKMRRKLLLLFVKKIYVLDKLLIKYAKKELNIKNENIIDYITFGKIDEFPKTKNKKYINAIKNFYYKNKKENNFFALCIGSPANKVRHFKKTIDLINTFKENNYKLFVIVIGPLSKSYDKQFINELDNHKNILLFDDYININEREIKDFFDFYWRSYDDFSVSFSSYIAMSIKKPILCQGPGFIDEFVNHYKLGASLDMEFSNFDEKINQIVSWDENKAEDFFENHNWKIFADKIITLINRQ